MAFVHGTNNSMAGFFHFVNSVLKTNMVLCQVWQITVWEVFLWHEEHGRGRIIIMGGPHANIRISSGQKTERRAWYWILDQSDTGDKDGERSHKRLDIRWAHEPALIIPPVRRIAMIGYPGDSTWLYVSLFIQNHQLLKFRQFDV